MWGGQRILSAREWRRSAQYTSELVIPRSPSGSGVAAPASVCRQMRSRSAAGGLFEIP